jgi:hypothetical protein
MVNFQIGDLVIYNGTKWVLTTPAAGVSFVNGAQGSVVMSMATANGFAGTYSGTALTVSTTITGLLKGNGTAISAATAGTDYVIPSGSITGTAGNITATTNSTLTTLSSLALPTSQLTAGGAVGTMFIGNGTFAAPSWSTSGVLGITGTATGSLQLVGVTAGSVTIKAPDSSAAWTMVLPNSAGTTGQFLTTQGSGTPMVWTTPGTSATTTEDIDTLVTGDITNQFVDLLHVATGSSATVNSISLDVVGGPEQLKGVDYTVSLTGGVGGVTRITFAGALATGGISALVAGDILMIKYAY